MSCFESSTFLQNPHIMNRKILENACKVLGWKYESTIEELVVFDVGQTTNLHNEYVLKVRKNEVTYNNYYLKNGKELVENLVSQFYTLNVEYAEQTVVQEFEKVGFTKRRDWDFEVNEKIVKQFSMIGKTRLSGEERETVIKFSILTDGTVISDSDYIPEDIHEFADKAMLQLDEAFGTNRREGVEIKRKPIPARYAGKTYCTASGQIKSKQETKTARKITVKY